MTLAVVASGGFFFFQSGGDSPERQPTAVPPPACEAPQPSPHVPQTYEQPPPMELRDNVDYAAVIYTSCGDMRVDLLEDTAPKAVNNFIFLARRGFYDGLLWHSLIADFAVYSGDPNGINGVPPDDAGYELIAEAPRSARAYTYGTLAFANDGRTGAAGSQFFVVVHDYEGAVTGTPESLDTDPVYPVFGRVREKYFGSLETLAREPTMTASPGDRRYLPVNPIYVEQIRIFATRDKKSDS